MAQPLPPPQQQQKKEQKQRWLPLEGTPEVLGPYLEALGGPREKENIEGAPNGAPLLQFEDLLALEPWAFDMLQCRDTAALLLLFPLTDRDEEEYETGGVPGQR